MAKNKTALTAGQMIETQQGDAIESNSVLLEIPMGEALGPVITYRTLKLTHSEATALNAAWIGLMERGHLVRGQEVKHPVDVFYYFLEQLTRQS